MKKFPQRAEIKSFKDIASFVKDPQAEAEAARKLWDQVFVECSTHEPKVCLGVIRREVAYYDRCPPCEKLHKEWRDAPKGHGSSTFAL